MTHLDGSSVTGAILIGGESRRMGQPKALIRVPADGPTMLERVFRVVEACSDRVVLVGTDRSVVPREFAEIDRVTDAGAGPVGGLIVALQASETPFVLLTGCDLPFLSATAVRAVIDLAVEAGRGVVPVTTRADGTETLQSLHAVYPCNQLGVIQDAFLDGATSLREVVERLDMVRLRADTAQHGDWTDWSFFNVNTPADLAIARSHARH